MFNCYHSIHLFLQNKHLSAICDRVRLHVCWGNWEGPHICDIAPEPLLHALYQANVGGLSMEFANARRQHEYAALRKHKLPDHMVLLPSVIDTKINLVEHPAEFRVASRSRVRGRYCGGFSINQSQWLIQDTFPS